MDNARVVCTLRTDQYSSTRMSSALTADGVSGAGSMASRRKAQSGECLFPGRRHSIERVVAMLTPSRLGVPSFPGGEHVRRASLQSCESYYTSAGRHPVGGRVSPPSATASGAASSGGGVSGVAVGGDLSRKSVASSLAKMSCGSSSTKGEVLLNN